MVRVVGSCLDVWKFSPGRTNRFEVLLHGFQLVGILRGKTVVFTGIHREDEKKVVFRVCLHEPLVTLVGTGVPLGFGLPPALMGFQSPSRYQARHRRENQYRRIFSGETRRAGKEARRKELAARAARFQTAVDEQEAEIQRLNSKIDIEPRITRIDTDYEEILEMIHKPF
jgi:hypothetical protein